MKRNLRHYSRVLSEFDISLETRDQCLVEAKIQNLSRSGLMILTDRQSLETLIPNTPLISPKHPLSISATFALPQPSSSQHNDNSKSSSITTECNIMYVRRLSREQFQLGLAFRELTEEGAGQLNHYIDQEQHAR